MLSVALVQSDLYWENATANLSMFEEQLATIAEEVDVIVLPEMFTTGFSMNPEKIAEHEGMRTTRWMKQIAAQYQALVIGSVALREAGRYYNRLLAVMPDGTVERYDKRHLFRMGGEDEVYEKGDARLVIQWKEWRICPLICYDLRFPVWSRNRADKPYDVLIYVANWPATRATVWEVLLKARAIENQAYTIGVNRLGTDSNAVGHDGKSLAIDYYGNILADLQDQAQIQVVKLSKESLQAFREKFPAHLDADQFLLS